MADKSIYKEIDTESFKAEVLVNKGPSVLVFTSEWSGKSEMMDGMIERLSPDYSETINFFKVDIDTHTEISSFFGISKAPTAIILKNGEVLECIKGFIPAKKMRAILNSFLSNPSNTQSSPFNEL